MNDIIDMCMHGETCIYSGHPISRLPSIIQNRPHGSLHSMHVTVFEPVSAGHALIYYNHWVCWPYYGWPLYTQVLRIDSYRTTVKQLPTGPTDHHPSSQCSNLLNQTKPYRQLLLNVIPHKNVPKMKVQRIVAIITSDTFCIISMNT